MVPVTSVCNRAAQWQAEQESEEGVGWGKGTGLALGVRLTCGTPAKTVGPCYFKRYTLLLLKDHGYRRSFPVHSNRKLRGLPVKDTPTPLYYLWQSVRLIAELCDGLLSVHVQFL